MATLKSMLDAVRDKLLAATWPGSSNRIFGPNGVAVTRGAAENAMRTMSLPAALVIPGTIRSDPQYDEEPTLWVVDVIVRIFVIAPGEALGENPLMGSNRSGSTTSEGAGMLDLVQEVCRNIAELNVADGADFSIQFRQKGGVGGVHLDEKVMWLYQDLEFEAVCTGY